MRGQFAVAEVQGFVELRFRCFICGAEAEVKRRRRVVVNFAVHRDACRLAARHSGHELDDLLERMY